ncbi:hypothetical protein QUA24_17590 [Microcoleus sp. Pol12B5]
MSRTFGPACNSGSMAAPSYLLVGKGNDRFWRLLTVQEGRDRKNRSESRGC